MRVIPLEWHSGAMNMALDEACCQAIAAGTAEPTLRFFRWKPSCVTIGYFQALEKEVNLQACKKAGVDVVRRRTGGGAVYHDEELTYSMMAPQDLFPKDITKSYAEVCGMIVKALSKLGIGAVFSPVNDVLVDGRKVSGSAQTRRDGILHQHGTILFKVDPERMFDLLIVGQVKRSDKFVQSVKKAVVGVNELWDGSFEEFCKAVYGAFTEGRDCKKGSWSASELKAAEKLAKEKYGSAEWNAMR